MRQRAIGALLLISVSVFLGATVLQDQVASAKSLAQDVFVNNTPAQAVPVREQNRDADGNIKVHEQGTAQVQEVRVPFQVSSSFDDWDGGTFRTFSREIPAGKRLIVQTVSVSAIVEAGQAVRAEFTAQGAGGLASHPIELVKQGTFAGNDFYAGTEAVTAYAAGSFGLIASVVRSSATGSGGRVSFSVSGYLVDE